MRIKKNYFIIFLALFIIFILFFYSESAAPKQFVSNQTFVTSSDLFFNYEITKFPSKVEIVSPNYEEQKLEVGLVTDIWNLNFGTIPAGGYGTRHLEISNYESKGVRVYFNVYGDAKNLVRFSQNNFILNPGQSTDIDVFLNTSSSTEPGNYSGEIDVVVKKANFDFLYSIL